MATVVGMRTVLLKTSPFSQARVPLRLGLAPHTGTGHAFRGDAAASYTVWKVRTTFGDSALKLGLMDRLRASVNRLMAVERVAPPIGSVSTLPGSASLR